MRALAFLMILTQDMWPVGTPPPHIPDDCPIQHVNGCLVAKALPSDAVHHDHSAAHQVSPVKKKAMADANNAKVYKYIYIFFFARLRLNYVH
jgi:hypothetical protein